MGNKLTLQAAPREAATLSHIRTSGHVPAVVYGHGGENQQIQVPARAFGKILSQAGQTSLVDLQVGEEHHNVLIREVQLHPLRDNVTHVDFYRVRLDEKVKADVPLTVIGESIAVKDLGGVLVRNLDTLEIEALPQDLPHEIEVDISSLSNFEAAIHVSDLNIPSGVTVLQDAGDVVALVQPPRSEEEIAELSEAVTEDVTAVEGVVKPEKEAEVGEGEAAAEGDAAKPEPAPSE
jgi:large subunit ribosomal protein L25